MAVLTRSYFINDHVCTTTSHHITEVSLCFFNSKADQEIQTFGMYDPQVFISRKRDVEDLCDRNMISFVKKQKRTRTLRRRCVVVHVRKTLLCIGSDEMSMLVAVVFLAVCVCRGVRASVTDGVCFFVSKTNKDSAFVLCEAAPFVIMTTVILSGTARKRAAVNGKL